MQVEKHAKQQNMQFKKCIIIDAEYFVCNVLKVKFTKKLEKIKINR